VMVYIALAFAVGLFAIGLRMIGVVPRARRVFGDANQALRIMQAPDLSDDQKAVRIRSASLDMFGAFFAILSRTLAAILVPAAIIVLAIEVGLFDSRQAAAASADWRFLIVSAALVSVLLLVRR